MTNKKQLFIINNYLTNKLKKIMKYFTFKNNNWDLEVAEIYNLTNMRQVNLYEFCEKTQTMIHCGIGLY